MDRKTSDLVHAIAILLFMATTMANSYQMTARLNAVEKAIAKLSQESK